MYDVGVYTCLGVCAVSVVCAWVYVCVWKGVGVWFVCTFEKVGMDGCVWCRDMFVCGVCVRVCEWDVRVCLCVHLWG